MAQLNAGDGLISGNIYEEPTDYEISLQNVLVMLLNTEDECVALDYSNSYGEFLFSSLAFDTYKLLVEIIGISMDPIIITLSSSEPEKSDINLYVIDDLVVFGIDDGLPYWIDYISEIYPNPAKHGASINIRLNKPSSLSLRINNNFGQAIQENSYELNQGDNLLIIDLQTLSSGVFYVSFEFSDRYRLTKKLLVLK